MDQFKTYQFTINVKTNHNPRDAIVKIVSALKGMLPVLSVDYHLVEDRPTDVEHHGGVVNDSEE